MTGEPLMEDYDAYALGMSEGEELELIRRNISLPAVKRGIRLVAQMSAMVELVEPPMRLRRRVVAMVDAGDRARVSQWPWWVALGVVLGGLLAAGVFVRRGDGNAEARFRDAVAVLSASDMRHVPVHEGASRVDVFSSESRGVLLLASHFPPAPGSTTYEMWTIAKNAAPVPAGVFRVRPDGMAVHQSAVPVKSLAAVALTVEPEGGSDHPTTKPFLVAAVP